MPDRSAPQYRVLVVAPGKKKRDWPRLDVTDRVISFSYEDDEKKADKVSLTIDNFDLSQFEEIAWRKGTTLEISWGYEGNMAPARQVVIKKVVGFTTLKIEGFSKAFSMDQVKKRRTFEGMTRAEVVRQIAIENGFEAPETRFIEDTKVKIPTITQANLTDAQMIRRLAKKQSFQFFVDYDGLHFHRRVPDQDSVRSFTYYTDQGRGDILSINVENDVTRQMGAMTVETFDPKTKRRIKQEIELEEDNRATIEAALQTDFAQGFKPVADILRPPVDLVKAGIGWFFEDDTSARDRILAAMRAKAQFTVKMNMKAIGDPQMIAKSVVEVNGLGSAMSGRYYVSSIKHTLSSSGYGMSLKLIRDGTREKRESKLLIPANSTGSGLNCKQLTEKVSDQVRRVTRAAQGDSFRFRLTDTEFDAARFIVVSEGVSFFAVVAVIPALRQIKEEADKITGTATRVGARSTANEARVLSSLCDRAIAQCEREKKRAEQKAKAAAAKKQAETIKKLREFIGSDPDIKDYKKIRMVSYYLSQISFLDLDFIREGAVALL